MSRKDKKAPEPMQKALREMLKAAGCGTDSPADYTSRLPTGVTWETLTPDQRQDWILHCSREPAITDAEREKWGIQAPVYVSSWGKCSQHGRYPLRTWLPYEHGERMLRPHTECPVCHELAAVKKRFGRACVPARFAQAKVSDWRVWARGREAADQARAKSVLSEYAAHLKAHIERGDNIVLSGGPGTGKSLFACALINAAVEAGYSGLFVAFRDMLRDIRSSWDRDSQESEAAKVKKYVQVDLLVIDEVGIQYGTDSERGTIYDVINGRYITGRPTILISNYPPEAARGQRSMSDYVGPAAWDRITKWGSKILIFGWGSYRENFDDRGAFDDAA